MSRPDVGWWRAAFYPWGYPRNPDGRDDSALCPTCGPSLDWEWEPGLAVVTYVPTPGMRQVRRGERCFMCGLVR